MVKHLNPNIVYHCENKLLFDDVVMAALLLTYYLSWIFVVTLKQQSTGIDISLHSYTLYWLLSHIHLSSYYSMLDAEQRISKYQLLVYSLTVLFIPMLKHMIFTLFVIHSFLRSWRRKWWKRWWRSAWTENKETENWNDRKYHTVSARIYVEFLLFYYCQGMS